MDKKYCIYKITNLINGKTYIGQHKYKKLDDTYMGSGVYLGKAKKKYGIENFKKEIILSDIDNRELANDYEQFYILWNKALGKAEYNLDNGGKGPLQFTSETRQKLSNAHKGKFGKNNGMYGKHHTEETKKRISESVKLAIPPETRARIYAKNTGQKRTAETREKMSKAMRGKIRSAEHCLHLSEALKGRHYYTNGIITVRRYECPAGFWPGRICKRGK